MNLAGKRLVVIGGSGYVGGGVARHAARLGINTVCISRRGAAGENAVRHDLVSYVKGDSMSPDAFIEELARADAVVHTIGTLIDTTITHGKNPGDPGSYEQMNFETAKRVGDALNGLQQNKKMVYVSACASPPLIPRYLENKLRAEEYLRSLPHIKTTALRPGFIYSSRHRGWSIPLKYMLDVEGYVYDCLISKVPENSSIKAAMKNYMYAGPTISLDDVALAAIYNGFHSDFDGKHLFKDDMVHCRHLIEKHNVII